MHAGNYDEALGLKQSVLRIMQEKIGAEHQDTVPVLLDLALCYVAEKDNSNAEAALKRAITIEERMGQGLSPEAGRILERYSCLLRKAGNSTKAEVYKGRSSDILFSNRLLSAPTTGRVVNGKLLTAPQPGYPAEAKKGKIAGAVTVLITISEEGRVLDACAVDGPPVFAAFAEDAAMRALYTPTTLAGSPVKVRGSIVYNFKK
jgi:TonB family protein